MVSAVNAAIAGPPTSSIEERIHALLSTMTLAEKVGQMRQANVGEDCDHHALAEKIRAGRVGSLLNIVDVDAVNEVQRIAVEESRLGIPLLIGRDVIHGFNTVMPIPLGQAASFNPDLVKAGAGVAAKEAARVGINWTFAPMIDVSRDPRWGRIAESFGEDPYLTSTLGVAMVHGFQGDDLSAKGMIAACAKHFAGYGAAESGRDYATTNIPENELRNVYLQPFKAVADASVATMMTSFCEIDGVPASANEFLLRQILRDEWQFDGLVVSDWDSIRQLQTHGLAANARDCAVEAATAGVDMEMFGDAYLNHLEELVDTGVLDIRLIDSSVANILRTKFRLGLFDEPFTNPDKLPQISNDDALAVAMQAALQSMVLLENDGATLPLNTDAISTIAIIGPLADAPHQQMGTWVFDGNAQLSVTPLQAIRTMVGDEVDVRHLSALEYSRSRSTQLFDAAVALAGDADVTVLFLGEEAILSGEAHSRADISLPGAQEELVARIRKAGKPVVAVVMAGRPLTLTNIIDHVDAILFAWHPGSMGGPAIADLLFGLVSPSGKLPASFPRMVGQIPIHYNRKNTGKPPSPDTVVLIDDFDVHASQWSDGMTSYHLDAGYEPLYPFGHGLSYGDFDYSNIKVSAAQIREGEAIVISVDLVNNGEMAAEEVAQLYVRDLIGNVTRPVRELKGFQRVWLAPGESRVIEFELQADDLAFYGRNMQLLTEPGEFHAWIGGSSTTQLRTEFRIVAAERVAQS